MRASLKSRSTIGLATTIRLELLNSERLALAFIGTRLSLRGLADSGVEGFASVTTSTALMGQSWSNGSRLNRGLKILKSVERPSNQRLELTPPVVVELRL